MRHHEEQVFPFSPCLECPIHMSHESSWREDIGLRMTDIERQLKELSERPVAPLPHDA